jgi:hypothetical protein
MNKNITLNSGLGWIDFSDEDKGKVMKVIELLQEGGTVDELGIGVIRNSLSDAMFNGITTIQTRAKYFFIVPYILQSYLSEKKRTTNPQKYLYDEETRLMNELTWDSQNPELDRIIGHTIAIQNKGKSERSWKQVERKPSTIYWNGLRQFGFVNTALSLSNLLKLIEKNHLVLDDGFISKESEKGDDIEHSRSDVISFKVPYRANWKEGLSMRLTKDEAEILKHQIIDTQKDQLLAQIVANDEWMKELLSINTFSHLVDLNFFIELPKRTQQIVYTAIDFWEILYGAHIRFNILLNDKYGTIERKEEYVNLWKEWKAKMDDFDWHKFDRSLMWQITDEHSRIKRTTRMFVDNWINGLINNLTEEELDKLVEKQEKDNKKARAKLRTNNDERYSGWVGISQMEYRFGNMKQVVFDITQGLGIEDA